jgi:hypothetical protein
VAGDVNNVRDPTRVTQRDVVISNYSGAHSPVHVCEKGAGEWRMAARTLFKTQHARRLPRDKRQRAIELGPWKYSRDQTSHNLNLLLAIWIFVQNIF